MELTLCTMLVCSSNRKPQFAALSLSEITLRFISIQEGSTSADAFQNLNSETTRRIPELFPLHPKTECLSWSHGFDRMVDAVASFAKEAETRALPGGTVNFRFANSFVRYDISTGSRRLERHSAKSSLEAKVR